MHIALATLPSRPERPNEDFVAVTDDLVVVLDGATVPGGLDTGCSHGTRWFTRKLGGRLLSLLAPEPGLPLADALAEAISTTADEHGRSCDIAHPGHPSATVALLRENEDAYEYLVLGDSSVVLDLPEGVRVVTDNRFDDVAVAEHRALAAVPLGTDEHAEALRALALELRVHCNVPGGYWVAAAAPQAAHEALTGSAPRSSVARAAVLTDGASIIADTFGELKWPELLDVLAGADGPAELIRRVRTAELADPQGLRQPRNKVHDDATAVFCRPRTW
ncbi:protein phosphatase 2C domain-containing protein [Streptomyces sp. NBC_00102]|uniref:protein phosphatase 2C domain-containing protein n=1 Tax=Streptomyces sp. NBC_00102 TaxID=2975652 RepID=UPI0022533F8B|nr:protein phosphatase 2C domain-containing protein [Streptomyces sp. NBC_00102]MCX5398057.1 protein phosphatase 2C domain-containing protein [Streptomyces sp. NBC_00102]